MNGSAPWNKDPLMLSLFDRLDFLPGLLIQDDVWHKIGLPINRQSGETHRAFLRGDFFWSMPV
jgi:hypothetical protein